MFYILYRNGDNCLSNSEPSDYIPDVPLFLREQSAEVLDIDDQCRYIHGFIFKKVVIVIKITIAFLSLIRMVSFNFDLQFN
jgi:hypothetical protein